MNLTQVRQQIPLVSNTVYLDNAGAGPPPVSVHNAMQDFLNDWCDHGERWEQWLLDIVESRELFAKLVRAHTDEIACIPNVSSGLGAIATSMQFRREQNVVVSELNFPTNIYVWHTLQQRGLIKEVRVLKTQNGTIPLSAYEHSIDDNTSVVSIDYVSWTNGCREKIIDISKLAHAHGALMLVDAFHAAGVLPIDVGRVDADVLLCGTYKWLMGPHGAAFIYVRRDVLDRLEPSVVGWHGVRDSVIARLQSHQDVFGSPFDLTKAEAARDATRFEWGTWAVVAVQGARAALKFTLEYPPEERWPLIRRLNERLVDGLRRKGRRVTSPLDEDRLSGIVTFEINSPAQVAKRLMEAHIVVAPRVNALRASPHFYNTDDEVDKLVERV